MLMALLDTTSEGNTGLEQGGLQLSNSDPPQSRGRSLDNAHLMSLSHRYERCPMGGPITPSAQAQVFPSGPGRKLLELRRILKRLV
jgi:hypothetical protein